MSSQHAGAAHTAGPQARLHSAFTHLQAGRAAEAQHLLEAVLAADPGQPEALHLLGIVHYQAGRHERALALVNEALAAAESNPLYWNTLGSIQQALGQIAQAIQAFARAIELDPTFAIAQGNLGLALHAAGKFADAEAALRRAIKLAPSRQQLHADLGGVLLDAGQPAEAAAAYRSALQLGPASRALRLPLSRALMRQGQFDEAIAVLHKELDVNPGDRAAADMLDECRFFICDWSEFDRFAADYRRNVLSGARTPAYEAIFSGSVPGVTRADSLTVARGIAGRSAKLAGPAPAREIARVQKSKLRIGYISADFRDHPVAHLIAGTFEHHDRRQFEVFAYSIGPDSTSPLRTRLVAAFDSFVDVRELTIAAAADRIAADRVDVLVDLSGFMQISAAPILALRPAPVQVNFLGIPGTLGADYVDYIVADRFIIPSEHAADYAEAPAYLPNCYMPNDRKRAIAERPTREACGLPAEGFVFCCFNSAWKITPGVLNVWMDLLAALPGSVLWLRDFNAAATRNLRAAAEMRGLGNRLVFAPLIDYERHLARMGCADLFLDTLPYNAHATASDALWAGLPVLTCVGDTFAARVGGSVLAAAGLPELITGSLEEYRTLALRLARDPEVLRALRERLTATRLTCPLFDTAKFTRDLETLYRRMWDRYAAGEAPAAIDTR